MPEENVIQIGAEVDIAQVLKKFKTLQDASDALARHMGDNFQAVSPVASINKADVEKTTRKFVDDDETQRVTKLAQVIGLANGEALKFTETLAEVDKEVDGAITTVNTYTTSVEKLKEKTKGLTDAQKILLQKAGAVTQNFADTTEVSKNFADQLQRFGAISEIVGQNMTKVSTNGQQMGIVVETTNGKFIQLTETMRKLPNGFRNVSREAKDVTSQFGKTAIETLKMKKSADGLAESWKKLAGRALLTIPIWLLLRAILTGTLAIIKASIKFMIEWEYQMAQIAIVSGGSVESLQALSGALVNISKEFGISTQALGESAKLWAQQGRAMEEIIPLMRTTAKLSLLTGQTTIKSVEDLTAILKAYKIEAKNATTVVDSMTNVMLNHAVSAADLASAYKQVASTASSLGVSFEELTGYITAIRAVTRDSGSKVGLALRTMFSRITTSSAQTIQNIASVPLYLDRMGKATFHVTPVMRNLSSIITELSLTFKDLGTAQQSQLASAIGGVRRQNQVFALFNNFTEAIRAQTDAMFGLGKSSEAIKTLTNTAKVGIDRMKNSWFSLIESLGNVSAIIVATKLITKLIEAQDKLINPEKAIYKERLAVLVQENDELARQLKFVQSLQDLERESVELDKQRIRARGKQGQLDRIAAIEGIRREGVNKGAEALDLDITISESSKGDFTKTLGEVIDVMNQYAIDTMVAQLRNEAKQSLLSLGAEITPLLSKAIDPLKIPLDFEGNKGGSLMKGGGLYDLKLQAEEVLALVEEAKTLGLAFTKVEIVNNQGLARAKVLLEESNSLEKEAVDHALNKLNAYVLQKDALQDTVGFEKKALEILQARQEHQRFVLLVQEKEAFIAKAVLEAELKRLEVAGARTSVILNAEKAGKRGLIIEDTLEQSVTRQLKAQEAITAEKKKQREFSQEQINLFKLAQGIVGEKDVGGKSGFGFGTSKGDDVTPKEGLKLAKAFGDVIEGVTDFATFWRGASDETKDIFEKTAPGFKEQKQLEQFYRGDRVSDLPEARGGGGINIGNITPATIGNLITQIALLTAQFKESTLASSTVDKNVGQPVDLEFNINVDISDVEEVSTKVGKVAHEAVIEGLNTIGSPEQQAVKKIVF